MIHEAQYAHFHNLQRSVSVFSAEATSTAQINAIKNKFFSSFFIIFKQGTIWVPTKQKYNFRNFGQARPVHIGCNFIIFVYVGDRWLIMQQLYDEDSNFCDQYCKGPLSLSFFFVLLLVYPRSQEMYIDRGGILGYPYPNIMERIKAYIITYILSIKCRQFHVVGSWHVKKRSNSLS